MAITPGLPLAFTRRQALDAGLSDQRLRTMVERGRLTRIRPGAYSRPWPPPVDQKAARHLDEARAALDQFATGFVASHLTAAAAHGLPLPLGLVGAVHLTAVAAHQRSRRRPGVVIHHCDSTLTELDTAQGVVVTAIARTLADCLRCFDPRVSVPLADHALREGMCNWEEIRCALGAQRRWRGRPRALEALQVVDGRRETWLESYAFMSLSRWGIDLPVPQVIVRDEHGAFVARVDGGWLEDLTVFEVDGRGKYELGDGHEGEPDEDEDGARRRSAFFREKSRHNDLGNLGLVVVRCELADLRHRSAALIRHIAGQRAAGRRGVFRGEFEVLDSAGLAAPAIRTHDTPHFFRDAGSESGVS